MVARVIIATWFSIHATTVLASLPLATGDISRPECIDAMKLAKAMYESTAQRLYAPLEPPKEMQSRLVLGASGLDISGGDALQSTTDFEKLPQDNRNIYWSRDTNGGLRVVVREIPVGWRGDVYALYLLDGTVQKETFLSNIDSAPNGSPYQPVVSETWRPPLVFQRDERGAKWFIDVGQLFQVLGDWSVYTSKERHAICTIAFHPPAKDPIGLLPKQVGTLALKLDEALGPGNDEGTLQPTATTRLHVKHVLANAALRPWALSDADAYNSRSEVDAGLEDWAKVNGSRRRLYNEIRKAYPAAEHSLATYYVSAYGLQPRKAQEVAAWALDLIFRSHFVFSSGGDYFRDDDVRTNPWPPKH